MEKNQVEKHKPDEKKKLVAFEEEKHVYSTGRSTVEVTVKLRKRKSQSSDLKPSLPSEHNLRTGSWADIFNQNQRHQLSKRHTETQTRITDKRPDQSEEIQAINLNIQRENESLKRQTATLSDDLNKAKAELKECFTTIKDLRKLSDLLKYENECLMDSRTSKAELEDSLKKTLAENQKLKKQLNKLSEQYSQLTIPKDKQISMFRSGIKEIKSTIVDEIDEMRNNNICAVESSPSLFQQYRIDENEHHQLNDTNASEIHRILNSTSSISLHEEEAERSSTQYMHIPKGSSSSEIGPAEVDRVSSKKNWTSGTPVRTSDLNKEYSAQVGEGKRKSGIGKGDYANREHPLKDSKGLIQLSLGVASATSSEYMSSSSSTINEYRRT